MSDHISETVSAGQLRSFVERIERVEEEIKELNADKSDIYKEVRSAGFDVKAVRQCVAARKLDSAEREERNAIFDLYWAALTGSPSRVHVHEAKANPPSPATAPSPAGEAGDEPQTSSAPSFPDLLSNEVDDGRPLPSANVPSAQNAAVPLSAVGQGGVTPAQGSDEFAQQPASAPQVRNEAESESGASVSHFTNPRCQKPDTCPNAHRKDTCFDCTMAWAKRPKEEQVMLWQQAVEASRTQAA